LFLRNFLGIPPEEVEEARNRGSFLAPLPNFLGIPAFFSSWDELRNSEDLWEFLGIPNFPEEERKFLDFLFLRTSHLSHQILSHDKWAILLILNWSLTICVITTNF